MGEGRLTAPSSFGRLMPHRVRSILLVASLYDAFTFQENAWLAEMMLFEQAGEQIGAAPQAPSLPLIERVSTSEEALQRLRKEQFDLVISLLRVSGAKNAFPFVEAIKALRPGLPVLLLATSAAELSFLDARVDHMARLNLRKSAQGEPGAQPQPQDPDSQLTEVWTWPFIWQGDPRLFTAMIKCVEDRLNLVHDLTLEPEIRVILLVEDNVKFYSSYLPMLYTELVRQQQAIMADTLTPLERLKRRRARPKIILANTFEEGIAIYRRFKDNILCAILDMAFPKDGRHNEAAGLEFARIVRAENSHLPIAIQSQDPENAALAASINAHFMHKLSSSLLHDFREFLFDQLGFGPFHFRLPSNGKIIATATDLTSFTELLETDGFSDISLIYHTSKNQFSTWLAARGEFELAAVMRTKQLSEFESTKHMRRYVVEQIQKRRRLIGRGEVTDFSKSTFNDSPYLFSRIGEGSLGGKGRGLSFVNSLITQRGLDKAFPDIEITVPPTLVLATDVFDHFMEDPGLFDLALGKTTSDQAIFDAFMTRGRFSDAVVSDLRAFLSKVRYPLVVRSSSLFEDTFRQPFAGIYRTHVLSNRGELEQRLEELLQAVRSVYSSTFSQEAKAYVESTSYRTEEMKMAVIIQRFAGRTHGEHHYPDLAGVARAYNFYPAPGEVAEDGVALGVLGLGSAVMDGGVYTRFGLGPGALPLREGQRYPGLKLGSLQRTFLALHLGRRCFEGAGRNRNVVELGMDVAERHGTLAPVGSRFNPSTSSFAHLPYTPRRSSARGQDAGQPPHAGPAGAHPLKVDRGLIDYNVHGLKQVGVNDVVKRPDLRELEARARDPSQAAPDARSSPVVTLSNILGDPTVALKQVLSTLLKLGNESLASPVEIEWALTLSPRSGEPHTFSVLQIRPMSNFQNEVRLGVDRLPSSSMCICACSKALGNGLLQNIRDIVFVPRYDRERIDAIVSGIAAFNTLLLSEKRPYILISPGSFGSKDPGKGLPVSWQSISGAACLVETQLDGVDTLPSEGTHFFQNITSFGIGYFSVGKETGSVDYQWLEEQAKGSRTDEPVKRIQFDKPLDCAIDGLSGCAVIMKPGYDLNAVLQANAFMNLEANPVFAKL